MNDYDVIVIGAGGAGLAAASVASETGARVLLLEAGDKTGGSTSLSGGVFYAAGTSLQREAGVHGDTAAAMYHYYMTLNQYKLEASVVRRICEASAETFEWLRSLGVAFRPEDLYVAGVDEVRRGHVPTGAGASITSALEGSFAGRGVDVATHSRVDKLLIEDGAVRGVVVGGEAVRAAATVIATGGFGNNPELLKTYYPDATLHGDLHWYIGKPTCVGDGLKLGQSAGAEIAGRNRGLLLLTPGFAKDLEVYLPGWLILVNRHGHRFMDETLEYSVLAAVLSEQPGRDCFGIFDEASRRQSKFSESAPNWSAERLAEHVDSGLLTRADSIAELATAIGIAPAALETAVQRTNADVEAGADRDFFKRAEVMRRISEPPFYAARIRAGIICWTGTGLRIDREAHVLDTDGRAIPGLYGAGEATGGMFGECYAAGGASVGNAVIFGRIAGRNAAEDAGFGQAAPGRRATG